MYCIEGSWLLFSFLYLFSDTLTQIHTVVICFTHFQFIQATLAALKRALRSIGVSSCFHTPMEHVLCTFVCCNSVKRTCEDSLPAFFPWPYILLRGPPKIGYRYPAENKYLHILFLVTDRALSGVMYPL